MGIITKLFEKRAWADQEWIQDWLNGGSNYGVTSFAGVKVSEDNSIKYSAVLACIRIISETIASLPLFVYKRLPQGKDKALDHPLYNLLHSQPNPEMTSFIYREMMVIHLLLWGNSYSEIIEDRAGRVNSLWPLLPWNMKVLRDDNSGQLIYKYKLPDNTEKIIPTRNILHIKGLSFDGLVGKSLIAVAREAIGLGMALEEFGARYFGQGTNLGAVIEHPKTIGEKAESNLRAALKEKYQGISNAHRVLILEEGMKFNKSVIPPNDSQFIESRKFQVNEIARIFNVPPHLIKDLERATFDNIEHQGIEFVVYTIRPWLVRIEQAMFIRLLSESEKKLYFMEFLVDGLLRGDSKTRFEAYAIGKQWGWLSSDDVRELENMNPLPDGQGKIYILPLNMQDAKLASKPKPEPKQIKEEPAKEEPAQKSSINKVELRAYRSATLKSRLANSYKGLFEEAASRILKLERTDILKAAESIFSKRNINVLNFTEFLNDYYKDKYDEINKRIKPVINTYGKVISDAVSDEIGSTINDIRLDSFMNEYGESFNQRYIASSKNRLSEAAKKAMEQGSDPYKEIENKFNEWESNRPQVVANRETIKIAGAVSYFTYVAAGIQRMIWINAGNRSCPFCEEMDGQVMGVEQPFKYKSDSMSVDGQEPLSFSSDIFHPPLHGGCQCQLSPG